MTCKEFFDVSIIEQPEYVFPDLLWFVQNIQSAVNGYFIGPLVDELYRYKILKEEPRDLYKIYHSVIIYTSQEYLSCELDSLLNQFEYYECSRVFIKQMGSTKLLRYKIDWCDGQWDLFVIQSPKTAESFFEHVLSKSIIFRENKYFYRNEFFFKHEINTSKSFIMKVKSELIECEKLSKEEKKVYRQKFYAFYSTIIKLMNYEKKSHTECECNICACTFENNSIIKLPCCHQEICCFCLLKNQISLNYYYQNIHDLQSKKMNFPCVYCRGKLFCDSCY